MEHSVRSGYMRVYLHPIGPGHRLFLDFDNDGTKDLFISNGIPKRLNDIDYINFISNVDLQEKMRSTGLDEKDMNLIDRFPQIKIPNRFFKNRPDLQFHGYEY